MAVFETLDLTGMDIDRVAWSGGTLETRFGAGYGARARVAPPSGLHGWTISSGALPGDAQYGHLIDGLPRLDYYWEFFKRHTTGETDVFIFPFRGKIYHASFMDTGTEFERFSEDLFSNSGLQIRQRRVKGQAYNQDGSVHVPLEPSDLPLWGWWNADDSVSESGDRTLEDLSENDRELVYDETLDIAYIPNVQNGRGVIRFNAGEAKNGILTSDLTADIHHLLMAIRINEATFETYSGIVTAAESDAVLVGGVGTATFFDFAHAGYTYRLNGVEREAALQVAPMQQWGIVHVAFDGGIEIEDLQLGSDRDWVERFGRFDLGEMIICDDALTPEEINGAEIYLAQGWGVTLGV